MYNYLGLETRNWTSDSRKTSYPIILCMSFASQCLYPFLLIDFCEKKWRRKFYLIFYIWIYIIHTFTFVPQHHERKGANCHYSSKIVNFQNQYLHWDKGSHDICALQHASAELWVITYDPGTRPPQDPPEPFSQFWTHFPIDQFAYHL